MRHQQLTQAECDRLPVGACVHVNWSGGNSGLYGVTGHDKSGHARIATMNELRLGLPGMNYLTNISADPKLNNAFFVPFDLHEYQDKFPHAIRVFCMMLPGHKKEDEEKAIVEVTKLLNYWSRMYSGPELKVILRNPTVDGKVEWFVNPVTVDDYTAQTMAMVVLKLRQLENQMQGIG